MYHAGPVTVPVRVIGIPLRLIADAADGDLVRVQTEAVGGEAGRGTGRSPRLRPLSVVKLPRRSRRSGPGRYCRRPAGSRGSGRH